jgi:threonylcarbamoyladenosine tRNA methylthiotransferase MtaB
MKVFLKGLNGCTMRKQKLKSYADFVEANGHSIVSDSDSADKVILWTCGFREDFRETSVLEIDRYHARYPGKLIVAGCLPDISPESMGDSEEVIAPWKQDNTILETIFGNGFPLVSASNVFGEENICDDPAAFRKANPGKDVTFHDQFVKLVVSEGCNYECTYCSERLAFPPYRSFHEEELVAKCGQLVEKTGCYDVILLSDSLGEYGCDMGGSLALLMGKLFSIDPRVKIALNNLNPAGFMKFQTDILDFMKAGRIRHLNLPIQSASGKILKLMKRPYTREDIDTVFGILNDTHFTEFDTHIIVGFPGETEADFTETIQFVLRHRPKYVLASGCMVLENMSTAVLPDKVDELTKKRRLNIFDNYMRNAGIICNTDDSKLALERLGS